jgi:small GTP-binding protein
MTDEKDDENANDGIKIILLGESGVGKTNLINIAIGNPFCENEKSTAASSFSEKKIKVKGKEYKLNIWDTIGQESYRQLTKIFYNNSKIVLFVYDITSKKSFDELNYWTKDVESQLGDKIVKGVIANKMDLFLDEQVKEEEGEEYANSIGAKFLAFSAKTENPKKIEQYLAELVEEYLTKRDDNDDNINGRITLSKKVASRENKKHKCLKCTE